ncbi:MAG TPA: DUF2270 domain-containing protein [Rhodospirillaceae bacterium]|nr:DUF2270 domain-containing protein [Rhodospirillaceae bacterium]
MNETSEPLRSPSDASGDAPIPFSVAEIGALAHLYRGEVYRSTIWRTRLDTTTNWAVVTTGIAFSIAFSGANASPLPLILVGMLVIVFISYEGRRYRYFNVWRARARHLETEFFVPMLRGQVPMADAAMRELLAGDYCEPHHHITLSRACGRRLRSNYAWILSIQAVAYFGKLAIHPTPLTQLSEMFHRAAVGPIPGEAMVLCGVLFHASWIAFALVTYLTELRDRRRRRSRVAMG